MGLQTDRLLYRRQFILSPREINDFSGWHIKNILNKFFLYIHPDLIQFDYQEGNRRIILLGDLYDPNNIKFDNEDIVSRLIMENSVIDATKFCSKCAGRYIIFFIYNSKIYIFNDASASRKVYYTKTNSFCWAASQPHVLAKYAELDISTDKEVIGFYSSSIFKKHNMAGILDNTIFPDIKQLLPNKYLDLQDGKAKRFWPTKRNIEISLTEGVDEGSKMLSNIIESANNRNELMMPVTAGNDTRLLLAASRKVSSDIYYYIIWLNNFTEKHQDIVIPSRMLNKIGLEFNIIKPSQNIDSKFKEVYNLNNMYANKNNISVIYNFYKEFGHKINLPGRFSDISRGFLNTYRKRITPKLLAIIWDYKGNRYVIENYSKWINEIEKKLESLDYNILDLFNWEERNGNWYSQFQVDKDIAQEEFTPYNCRKLMDIFLSVPSKYRDVHTNIFYRAMIKKLWPELLSEPFNPNLKKYSSYYLKKAGLYWGIRRMTRSW